MTTKQENNMDDDAKVIITVTKLVLTGFAVFVLSVTACTAFENSQGTQRRADQLRSITEIVKSGKDPVSARCAVLGSETACALAGRRATP